MIDRKALLSGLQKQVKELEKDLRSQVETAVETTPASGTATPPSKVHDRLHAEYDLAFKLGRTAATWAAWRDERVTQAAVAWVLGTVFVRFCEDNGLLTSPYLAGPTHDRMVLAEEAQEEFFRRNPAETDRGWLLAAFAEIAASQAGALLFDRKHNPLYQIPVSHDAAKDLITFWRRRTETGHLVHDFVSDDWDTRFLGDLYQDLSEAARKTYALLQTPEFVEEFILDHTLTPAIAEFGHEDLRMIDPTCGSGHFVLGAFHRLLDEWIRHSPTRDRRELVSRALKSVHGVDINPFAIAIARFRLLITALKASGFTTADEAENYEFPLNLAIGDSLIKARQLVLPGMESQAAALHHGNKEAATAESINEQTDLFSNHIELGLHPSSNQLAEFAYDTEDIYKFPHILTPGSYHVIVGNPPYPTVADKKLNELYRNLYSACSGKYSLSIPFAQRFFELARNPNPDDRGAGYIGQITANSFMKRQFGKKIVEEFFRNECELTHIIDTSGAYIPGPGIPTVILIGRSRDYRSARSTTIRTVMGIRGESGSPSDPSNGVVWRSIVQLINQASSENNWIGVADIDRERFNNHPWSLSGGGAGELMIQLNTAPHRLRDMVRRIGIFGMTNADDIMLAPSHAWQRRTGSLDWARRIVVGEEIRDWRIDPGDYCFFPYDEEYRLQALNLKPSYLRWMWPARTTIGHRATFSKRTYFEEGRPWYEWHQMTVDETGESTQITFSTIATHGHFALDRSGGLFKQSAPIIKLRKDAPEDHHTGLLGILNSSTACFWLKQKAHNLGNTVDATGARRTAAPWEDYYEFTGTKLNDLPLPSQLPAQRGRVLDSLAQTLTSIDICNTEGLEAPSRAQLLETSSRWHKIRSTMISLQEELDWEVYSLYGLLDDDLTAPGGSVPELKTGERAFEIALARKLAKGEAETQWFARHGSTSTTELPEHWAPEYQASVEKRISLIEGDRNIGLIERPEHKRRWASEGWDAYQTKALRDWMLDRSEARELWFHDVDGLPDQPRLLSTAQLTDLLQQDASFVSVAELYAPGKELDVVVAELVAEEHAPYLAQLRYKDSGLDKRADWEDVWSRQRAEDAAESEEEAARVRDAIPVPPKYTSGDFLKNSYWRHRGKLDVPKERFISYPHANRDGDSTLLLGWAGWDHREQAQALATVIVDREQNHGWPAERLTPLLAGLREVLPWVRQWHDEFDPVYSGSPADVYEGFLNQYRDRLRLTDDDLIAWRPPKVSRGRRKA